MRLQKNWKGFIAHGDINKIDRAGDVGVALTIANDRWLAVQLVFFRVQLFADGFGKCFYNGVFYDAGHTFLTEALPRVIFLPVAVTFRTTQEI